MSDIRVETFVEAPPEVCFDLVRDHRIHDGTQTKVTATGTEFGQRITFESSFFGMEQRLTVEIVGIERPRILVDEMRQGAFKRFVHTHEFMPRDGGTLMIDTLSWTSPYGLLGRIADKLLIRRRMTRVVRERNRRLKLLAETAR